MVGYFLEEALPFPILIPKVNLPYCEPSWEYFLWESEASDLKSLHHNIMFFWDSCFSTFQIVIKSCICMISFCGVVALRQGLHFWNVKVRYLILFHLTDMLMLTWTADGVNFVYLVQLAGLQKPLRLKPLQAEFSPGGGSWGDSIFWRWLCLIFWHLAWQLPAIFLCETLKSIQSD